jgi:hypothetical protein
MRWPPGVVRSSGLQQTLQAGMSSELGAGVRIEVVEGWVEIGFGFVAVDSVLYMGGRIAGCWTCVSMLFVGSD